MANREERISFSRIPSTIPIPNLIEIQKESYHRFLQSEIAPAERADNGLQGVFKGIFPIVDYRDTCSLEFVDYIIGEPKYSVEECIERGMTFAAPLSASDCLKEAMPQSSHFQLCKLPKARRSPQPADRPCGAKSK